MRFNKQKLLASSLDWFMQINRTWIHAISLGGLIPDIVNDTEFLPQLQSYCSLLPDLITRDEVEINDELIEKRFERHLNIIESYTTVAPNETEGQADPQFQDEADLQFEAFRDRYADLFISMACKGFHSYARVDIDNPTDNTYHLIARPTEEASRQLSNEIFSPDFIASLYPEFQTYLQSLSITSSAPAPSFTAPLSL